MARIWTSYYAKMTGREKLPTDIYLQMSNSLFCLKRTKSGDTMQDEIDLNCGDILGNKEGDPHDFYEMLMQDDDTAEFVDTVIMGLYDDYKESEDVNIFLLCYENLESCYKASDKEVKNGLRQAGQYKECHRRAIAKYIKERHGVEVLEWDIKPENADIVYRDYC